MYAPPDLAHVQGMDIYLIDQIMKGRYSSEQHILDAGSGGGRNLAWFAANNLSITACDIADERENLIKARYPKLSFDWATCDLAEIPFPDSTFDHIICNAVLHFARDADHFSRMLKQLVRVLKIKGSLFIRTCSSIGIAADIDFDKPGKYILPDGSERFLIDRNMIDEQCVLHQLHHLEAIKSVNVDGNRVMTTLVMVRQSSDKPI